MFVWRRWVCSPLPLRADLCSHRAGDVQGLEPEKEGSVPSGSGGTRAPACHLLRAACTCLHAPVTPEQECKLHICLGFLRRSRWLRVTSEKQKCFLKWPNEPFIGGWRKKIKQAFRHVVTVLCRMYWNFSNCNSRNVHLEDTRNGKANQEWICSLSFQVYSWLTLSLSRG